MHSAVALLEPIHVAQLASIHASRVNAMDGTPIKAGQDEDRISGRYMANATKSVSSITRTGRAVLCKKRWDCRCLRGRKLRPHTWNLFCISA